MRATAPPRHDPAWYAPARLPPEFASLDRPVEDGLTVGAPGKVGLLELSLSPLAGVTRVQRQYQRAPLHVYRPIYLDAGRPDMAFVYVQQFGDGFVQGDRCRIDIDCAAGSAVHVTTQAATSVFTARDNFASQLVNLRADAGAVLEYLPDPTVPFRGSRLFQRMLVTADPEATVILADTLLPGRVARGEAHVYDLYWSETEVRRPDGTLLFVDTLRLNPTRGDDPRAIGLLGTEVVATLHVVTGRADPETLVRRLRAAVGTSSEVLAGVSELPNGCGASVRLLGASSKVVGPALRTAWNAARLALLCTPAPDLRKG